jgi:serine/threonine-protein kinase
MVTGQPPFPGKKIEAIFRAHLHQELKPPDHINTKLSSGLGEVVEFMMVKDRNLRYGTPRELIRDLESLQAGEAPKFARDRIKAATLKGLTDGDVAENDDGETEGSSAVSPLWFILLATLLGLSVILNIFLLLR